ncbi:RNA pyrophosphohydrolase [Brevundimonas sp. 2R-24]|uniref:RNA pyrophosphohydrolase n=1 Tax=Peiella sedimenti TaxID=3061083 RepID=A0ABT8SQF9_9CAUL|nr:RNA pyrophosphohydrolase [Caulobacteraceae bacterium XZ-24]
MSEAAGDFPRHRPNVGVVLINRDGLVWYGRRRGQGGPHSWQFPQGGVDPHEEAAGAYEYAARRELREETGVTSVEYLASTEGWIAYDFPAEILGRGKWRGQKQIWFAYRFTGEDAEVDLKAYPPIEFDAWRWGRLAEAPELIVPFKRPAYERVVEAFGHLAAD